MIAKQTGWLRVVPLASIVVALGLVNNAQATLNYGGRAYAAYVNTALTPQVFISDTGELASTGGSRYNALLAHDLAGLISAQVLFASTVGQRGQSISTASLANVVVLPNSPYRLTASFVRAGAMADSFGTIRNSQIVGLTFCGETIQVTGQPNQIVKVGVAKLIINEQTIVTGPNYREAQVNAIRLRVPGVAEVILSSARASIFNDNPGTPPTGILDAMTGCGEINPNNCRISFAFHAGYPANSWVPDGCFEMCDNSNGLTMKTISVTNFWGSGNKRTFRGKCSINGQSGYEYWVEGVDNGASGDTIKISLSNGYYREGVLTCGDINLCSRY